MPKRLIFPSDLSTISQTPCPSAFRLKDMHCEMFQPEIGILQPDWYSSDSWGIGFPEGYFSAETFHNAYPSAGMPMGRAFVEWLKDLKEK